VARGGVVYKYIYIYTHESPQSSERNNNRQPAKKPEISVPPLLPVFPNISFGLFVATELGIPKRDRIRGDDRYSRAKTANFGRRENNGRTSSIPFESPGTVPFFSYRSRPPAPQATAYKSVEAHAIRRRPRILPSGKYIMLELCKYIIT